jgi:hypothetical protein
MMGLLSARRRIHLGLLGLSAAGGAVALVLALIPAAPANASMTSILKNYQTGYCLDCNWHDPAASNPDQGAVYANPACNGGNWQEWTATQNANGTYEVQDGETDYCLDSNWHDPAASNPDQGKVYTLPCNGGTWQGWE